MNKEYTSLGFMSGTSGDGVDASIIQSDGYTKLKVIKEKYFEYDLDTYNQIHRLKNQINSRKDLIKYKKEIESLERNITLFHSKIFQEISKKNYLDFIGFHGQTIYHNPSEKISKQIGNGELLSQLTKKKVIYNFRNNDLKNNGQGAPLTPIFHYLIVKKFKVENPVCILNIGGISNITLILNDDVNQIVSSDVGPGNCMIDEWIRKNGKNRFDEHGLIASSGNINEIILESIQELYFNKLKIGKSLDTKDYDISFARGLSFEDGAATITELTARIISEYLFNFFKDIKFKKINIFLCGGGRKNLDLLKKIKNKSSKDTEFKIIDDLGINGDFIESQAFAFLAIRSFLGLNISYPRTTGCSKACTGGELIDTK